MASKTNRRVDPGKAVKSLEQRKFGFLAGSVFLSDRIPIPVLLQRRQRKEEDIEAMYQQPNIIKADITFVG
jgi:hypothetical protein